MEGGLLVLFLGFGFSIGHPGNFSSNALACCCPIRNELWPAEKSRGITYLSSVDHHINLLLRILSPRTLIKRLLVFGTCEKKVVEGFFLFAPDGKSPSYATGFVMKPA